MVADGRRFDSVFVNQMAVQRAGEGCRVQHTEPLDFPGIPRV